MSAENNIATLFPWITSSFVQQLIVRSEHREDVTVKSYSAKKCFESGENFASYMVGVEVFIDNGSNMSEAKRDFLIKIAIPTEEFSRMCEECLYYEKEIEAYTKVLPAIDSALNSVKESASIAPRCFLADVEKRMLVLEDLRFQGFKSVDRIYGLDMEHMKMALLNLAKWHAGTATLLLTNIELFEWHKKKMIYKNGANTAGFVKGVARTLSSAVKNWSGYEKIAEKLENIPQEAYDNVYKSYVPQEGGFNVITHGDLFMNNILFRYDRSGKPIDIRFVDFALGQHASPSTDLVRLLYSSTHSSIGWDEREHLVQYYHSELVKYLKCLKFPGKIPTLLDIQVESFRTDFYNALLVLFIIGLRFVNKAFDGGFLDVVSDQRTDGIGKLYSHPECIKQLKYLLDIFNRRGYFDF